MTCANCLHGQRRPSIIVKWKCTLYERAVRPEFRCIDWRRKP